MDEVVGLVVQKTGLPEPTARTAVETVIGYRKQKLPLPTGGQIDAAVRGRANIGDVTRGLGGLLGCS